MKDSALQRGRYLRRAPGRTKAPRSAVGSGRGWSEADAGARRERRKADRRKWCRPPPAERHLRPDTGCAGPVPACGVGSPPRRGARLSARAAQVAVPCSSYKPAVPIWFAALSTGTGPATPGVPREPPPGRPAAPCVALGAFLAASALRLTPLAPRGAAGVLGTIGLFYIAQQLKHPKIRAKLRDKWWLVECTISILMFFCLCFSGLGFFFCWCAPFRGARGRGAAAPALRAAARHRSACRLPSRGVAESEPADAASSTASR